MGSVEPTDEQLEALARSADDGSPVVMINLLRYRERAEYPPDFDAKPCDGRGAYQRYAAGVAPLVMGRGGRFLWLGSAVATLVGPAGERWDDAALVE